MTRRRRGGGFLSKLTSSFYTRRPHVHKHVDAPTPGAPTPGAPTPGARVSNATTGVDHYKSLYEYIKDPYNRIDTVKFKEKCDNLILQIKQTAVQSSNYKEELRKFLIGYVPAKQTLEMVKTQLTSMPLP